MVTPYVGVWIETCSSVTNNSVLEVTPYVGVWIETVDKKKENARKKSHLM